MRAVKTDHHRTTAALLADQFGHNRIQKMCIRDRRNALEKIDNVEKEFNTAKSELEMTEHVVREMAAQGKLDYITSIRDWREAGEKLNGLESVSYTHLVFRVSSDF